MIQLLLVLYLSNFILIVVSTDARSVACPVCCYVDLLFKVYPFSGSIVLGYFSDLSNIQLSNLSQGRVIIEIARSCTIFAFHFIEFISEI